jgi:transposase
MTESQMATVPEVEVDPKAQRRQFSAKYKLDILKRAATCTAAGSLGVLLRSEGLYSSHLSTWRRQRDDGELAGLTPRKRGRKKAVVDARDRKIAELQRENSRLAARAERAEALVELQKKVAALLETPLESDRS